MDDRRAWQRHLDFAGTDDPTDVTDKTPNVSQLVADIAKALEGNLWATVYVRYYGLDRTGRLLKRLRKALPDVSVNWLSDTDNAVFCKRKSS